MTRKTEGNFQKKVNEKLKEREGKEKGIKRERGRIERE